MFDLSRDFPPAPSREQEYVNGNGVNGASKKRKRGKGKERASGAGGLIPDERLGTGISRKFQRFIFEEVDEEASLVLDSAMDVDEDSGAEESSALERLRRGEHEGEGGGSGGGKNGDRDRGEYEARPHDWHTFKYRPIMGVVLVGEGDDGVGPEVAIVERPAWEAGLPGRWEGDQEWDREAGS